MQFAGQRATGERGRIDPVDRRVAVQHGIEFRGQVTPGRSADRFAAGEAVRDHRVGAEAGGHIRPRQRGELAEIANSHAPQQISQLPATRTGQARLGGQLPDRQCRQEHRVLAGWHHPASAGGEDGGRKLVGDAHLAFGAGRGHRVDQPLGGGVLGPEVAGRAADRQHQQPRPQHLGTGHHIVDRRDDPLEEAGIAGRVGRRDMQLRAAGLGLAAAQAPAHPGGARGGRAGDHPVGQGDRDRSRVRQSRGRRGGDRRPVHAPDGQHSAAHLSRPAPPRVPAPGPTAVPG